MMAATLAFIDTETTGLDPDRHEIWEVALILRDSEGIEIEYEWQLPVDLGRADPIALNIGRFHDRRWDAEGWNGGGTTGVRSSDSADTVIGIGDIGLWAKRFTGLTVGAHLVGAVVSFDEERLRRLLRANGECPMWHYHLIDVEALAAGWLAAGHDWATEGPPVDDKAQPPWDSTELSLAVGIDPDQFDRHTALGDAQWARAIYDAVMGGGE